MSLISPGEILIVSKQLLNKLPSSKEIAGLITDEDFENTKKYVNNNEIKISTICNLNNIELNLIDGDLISLQLNEGVIYKGQMEESEDAEDKYKYV